MPDMLLHFKLMQKSQRELEQGYLLSEMLRQRRALAWKRIIGRLRALFTVPAASEQQKAVPMRLNEPLSESLSEEERLVRDGFNAEQITAFNRFRRWYQMCNREHLVMLHHWEFLKQLVNDGKLEP